MAFTVTLCTNSLGTETSAGNRVTGSFTPPANCRLFVFATAERDNHLNARAWTISDSLSLTWTLLDSSTLAAWETQARYGSSVVCWYTDIGGSPASMTVTVDASTNNEFYSVLAFSVAGYDPGTPFAQTSVDGGAAVNPASNSASGTLTLGSNPTNGNLVVAMFGSGADTGGGFAAVSGFTELVNQNSSFVQSVIYYRTDTTAPGVTCSDLGNTVGNWGGIAFEMTLPAGGGTVNFTAASTAQSVTSGGALGVQRALSALGASQSATPNTAQLAILRTLSALCDAQSVTPDDTHLSIIKSFAASVGAGTVTGSSSLSVLRALNALCEGESVTPESVSLGVLRSIVTSLLAETSTPNAVNLAVLRVLNALCIGQSVTPDTGDLTVSRGLAAHLVASSATSTGSLVVLRLLNGLCDPQSATPDDVILSIAGLVSFAASVIANSGTNSPSLNVQRALSALGASQSATPETVSLDILRALSALCNAQSATPDNVALGVQNLVSFASSMEAASATSPANLAVIRGIIALCEGQSVTSETGILTVLRVLATAILVASNASDNTVLTVVSGSTDGLEADLYLEPARESTLALELAINLALGLSLELVLNLEMETARAGALNLEPARAVSVEIET